MESMRSTWTDERLDDLRDEVHALRGEANARFDAMDRRFDSMAGSMNARFDALNTRFDAMQRTLVQVGGGLAASLLAGLVALLAAQL